MKLIVAFVILGIALVQAGFIHTNGRPGCKTDTELNVQVYRNNWDSTVYWKCVTQGKAAIKVRCPDGTAWLESKKTCVEWDDWVWEKPKAPPSEP